jgi:hypothetical protein
MVLLFGFASALSVLTLVSGLVLEEALALRKRR